ncbi:hypothetical protein SAMN05216503_3452 [Polaribacter sp. KT25b]|nr:hypothetical protein SAMN05216503_3452 [Polaribacter sp. KT25b]
MLVNSETDKITFFIADAKNVNGYKIDLVLKLQKK